MQIEPLSGEGVQVAISLFSEALRYHPTTVHIRQDEAALALFQTQNYWFQFVLDGAFAQVHQQCHEGRQRKGAVAGEIPGVGAGTRREPLGIQILLDWSIDIFKFDSWPALLKQRVGLFSA